MVKNTLTTLRSRSRVIIGVLVGLVLLCGLGWAAYNFPPIHERLANRVNDTLSHIHDFFYAPQKVVFIPQTQQNAQIATIVAATLQALRPSTTGTCAPGMVKTTLTTFCQTVTPSPTLTTGPTLTPTNTQAPTNTPTAIPSQVELKGVVHEYQKMNNCGPTNLAMALSFWGWKGDQLVTAAFLRPGFKPGSPDNKDDKNVMPYEMVNFVQQETNLSIILRTGGDIFLLKDLIAAGFPVLVEKGFEGISFEGWMGHYEVVDGYNDSKGIFLVQDSYVQPANGITYTDMQDNWRAFDYTYLVIYPPEREAEVLSVLGLQADLAYNQQYTTQKAADEVVQLSGRDKFFALYNRGSSLVALQDYAGAASAYDAAYTLYPTIPEAKRPYRITWYQTGPYFAYYYSGRYYDVINLTTQTLDSTTSPGLEENWVWRARSEVALGDTTDAINDLKQALVWHPGFQPALDDLANLGVSP